MISCGTYDFSSHQKCQIVNFVIRSMLKTFQLLKSWSSFLAVCRAGNFVPTLLVVSQPVREGTAGKTSTTLLCMVSTMSWSGTANLESLLPLSTQSSTSPKKIHRLKWWRAEMKTSVSGEAITIF